MSLPKTSIEQWATLIAVHEENSFVAAAERLNKSQSTVSYNIKRLNESLPVPVIKLQGRKAQLTEQGHVLLRKAYGLLDLMNNIEASAHFLSSGWESELTIAIDALVHIPQILERLASFSNQNPQTRLRLLETTLSATDEALFEKTAQLAYVARIPPGFLGTPIGEAEKLLVAHPQHPIFSQPNPLTETELRRYRQIVVRDSGIKRNQDAGWLGAEQRWTVSSFAALIDAVKSRVGFASIPKQFIQAELTTGQLKPVPLQFDNRQVITLYLILAEGENAGPGAKALYQHLKNLPLN
ncbi:putative transcriptional regulator [Catenovulum agarivorans DS-2]|uniref:Putative transcriptional regulator n=1 Tax=Catenovulum agarivorans DS-2 TaxID=1328313 RepID=W7QPZ5_9ALTE|nr:LysR family transcriptional regulator [Catenovulum agarivorans]EWH09963.1 putative transcriptional regulator [Catenovulum agarivorans DS-2]